MICITIDGLNWDVTKEHFMDLFPNQSIKMIRNNVRVFTNNVQGGSPTPVGLFCLWGGTKIKDFYPKLLARTGLIKDGIRQENYPIHFIDKNGKKIDSVFNHFNKCKVQIRHSGPCPYKNNENYFQCFTELGDNVTLLESEDMAQFREFAIHDWDFLHIHTGIGKIGVLEPGPYEQCRLEAVKEYEEFRKNKPLKRKIWIAGMLRYKYVIQHIINEMIKDQIVVFTADHGTGLVDPVTPEQIDEIPLIVNRQVDLSDINYQWDVKKLILRLHEEENK